MSLARLTLDTTTVAAYALGSEDVGEVLRELADEGARFAIPAVCVVEAAVQLPDKAWPLLDVLVRLPHAVTVPLNAEDWRHTVSMIAGCTNGSPPVSVSRSTARRSRGSTRSTMSSKRMWSPQLPDDTKQWAQCRLQRSVIWMSALRPGQPCGACTGGGRSTVNGLRGCRTLSVPATHGLPR